MVSSVVIGRYVFLALGLATACTVLYTCITDGSPFRSELLIPWMSATLIDFYVNVAAIAVWYKESNLARRIIWIALLVCFGRFDDLNPASRCSLQITSPMERSRLFEKAKVPTTLCWLSRSMSNEEFYEKGQASNKLDLVNTKQVLLLPIWVNAMYLPPLHKQEDNTSRIYCLPSSEENPVVTKISIIHY